MPHSEDVFPLSKLQSSFWATYAHAPSSAAANRGSALRFEGRLDGEALARAYQGVVDRHPALRTTFGTRHGAPAQRVHPAMVASFEERDLGAVDEATLRAHVQRELDRPFDLERESIGRVTLLHAGPSTSVALFYQHHIHADMELADIVHDEVAAHYEAFRRGARPELPPPPAPSYARFVERERERLRGAEGALARSFWTDFLRDAPSELRLPVDRPRGQGPVGAGHANVVRVLLEPADLARARGVAKALGVSTYRLFLAAYLALLGRYTGQNDVLVALSADCRGDEFAGVAGNFVNPLWLRGRPDLDAPFGAFAARTGEALGAALRHRDYPLTSVLDDLRAGGTLPLARTGFVMGRFRRRPNLTPAIISSSPLPWRDDFGGGAVAHEALYYRRHGQLDLEVTLVEIGGHLVADLLYDAALFDRATVERFAAHYARLLGGALGDAGRALGDLPLLDEGERRRATVDWNATDVPVAAAPVHELFAAQAARAPDAIAVEGGGRRLTFGELDRRAEALARRLRRAGVGPDALVGVLLGRDVDFVVAVLAAWKAGGAYLPLDPDHPDERLRALLADAAPAAVVTSDARRSLVPAGTPVFAPDAGDAAAEGGDRGERGEGERGERGEGERGERGRGGSPDEGGAEGAGPSSLAYVIYTSGSTGKPKGVAVEHRGVSNYAQDLGRRWRVRAGDRLLGFAPFSFDSSVADLIAALAHGAALVIRPEAVKGGDELAELMRDARVTHAALPPAVWASLPEVPLPALATAVSSGDRCLADVVTRWGGGRLFLNEYGPTEVTVAATSQACEPGGPIGIGGPIGNARVFVLDERLQPAPVGVVGELYVGGAGVARGYRQDPAATAARFVPDPFGPPGARMYRTGDVARYRADGSLDFLGRTDEQVKIRGFRVEPAELEAALTAHPAVREAAVTAPFLSGEARRQLVAYVTLREPAAVDGAALRAFLKERVPGFLIPAHLVVLDAMPLTAHGKIDRGALRLPAPAPDPARDAGAPPPPPADDLRGRVLELWGRTLGVDALGPDDDFFEMGGDSLLALEAAHQASVTLGLRVTVGDVLAHPTVAGLLAHVTRGDASELVVALREGGSRPPLFVVHPAGGEVYPYAPLVAALDEGRPVFGLRSRAFGGAGPEHPSLEAMGRDYAEAIRARHPGPYYLFGWSMGGLVCLEIAHRLEAAGLEVAFVGLADSHRFGGPGGEEPEAPFAPELGPLAPRFLSLGLERLEALRRELRETPPGERAGRAVALARREGVLDEGAAFDERWFDLHSHHIAVSRGYVPPEVRAPVYVWRAGQSAAASSAGRLALGPRQRAEVILEGDHFSLLEPPLVRTLAAELSRALESHQG